MPEGAAATGRSRRGSGPRSESYEVETIFALERFALEELRQTLRGVRATLGPRRKGRLSVDYDRPAKDLLRLRSAVAVHRVLSFHFARPSGLMGSEHFGRLLSECRRVVGADRRGAYRTLSISAAGRSTTVFRRLASELCRELGLTPAVGSGDLAISVRPASGEGGGWEVLLRLTPRPLSARQWRVCNMAGALDATVANVVATLTQPAPRQRFLNIACGSSTMLIERLAICGAQRAVGADIDPEALDCSAQNLEASGHRPGVELVQADATGLPFEDQSFDAVVGDLPFGMLVKRGARNERFYRDVLQEAARVAAPGAVLALVANAHRSMRSALEDVSGVWDFQQAVRLEVPSNRGYISPAVYVAVRAGAAVAVPATARAGINV